MFYYFSTSTTPPLQLRLKIISPQRHPNRSHFLLTTLRLTPNRRRLLTILLLLTDLHLKFIRQSHFLTRFPHLPILTRRLNHRLPNLLLPILHLSIQSDCQQ